MNEWTFLLNEKMMQGKPIWVSSIRALAAGPQDVAAKIRTAERMGVEVKGLSGLSFQESRALYGG